MLQIVRTDSSHPFFVELVNQLDADLAQRDGSDHSFYSQFNTINMIKHAIVVTDDGLPIGCGAIKPFDEEAMEVKRMYTIPERRGQGIAGLILSEL